jgi:hypothetical protein
MCHHLVDSEEEYRVADTDREPDDEVDPPEPFDDEAADVELDRDYDAGDTKTPGDD